MRRSRALAWVCAALVFGLATARPVHAQDDPDARPGATSGHSASSAEPARVAVLPFAAADGRMQMYGKPVADAVVREVRAHLSSPDRMRVQAISLSGAVPKRVALVVDGRIVSTAGGKLSLEAHIRDPERGTRLDTLATASGDLTDIDQLAGSLGDDLAGHLEALLRGPPANAPAARERAPSEKPPPDTLSGESATRPHARSERDAPPPMAILRVQARAARGTVEATDIARDAAEDLVRALGYTPVIANSEHAAPGPITAEQARVALRQNGASMGLILVVRDVEFSWHGVLAARGRFRAVVFSDSGRTLYDRAYRTDTLVGNRSDRHRAVVRLVLVQIVDILRAQLAPLFRRHKPGSLHGTSHGR